MRNTSPAQFISRTGVTIFSGCEEVVEAKKLSEVVPSLKKIEACVARGLHAAGFISYEAAPAFDKALEAHPPAELPLLWFALYRERTEKPLDSANTEHITTPQFKPLVDKPEYVSCINRIREHIARGDTYQVNFTMPLAAENVSCDASAWFQRLCRAQHADYCGYVDTGRFQILSASPELFFRLDGERIETRPMKGTRPRGLWHEEDLRLAEELVTSEKDRAENAMIVDLLRNDLGRISETGSVRVDETFAAERYRTVWQMTSSVSARTNAPVPNIIANLFPCGSVTGAPKVRTMQIIRELERFPRGVYCGAVGWWSPGRRVQFNVAIRTVTLDAEKRTASYGTGGGITWGSTPQGEYDECLDKTKVLSAPQAADFSLLETMLYDGKYALLERHLERLKNSSDYFGITLDIAAVKRALAEKADSLKNQPPQRVRLLANQSGGIEIESEPLKPLATMRIGLAKEPIGHNTPFVYHKTTLRDFYARHKASRPDCDDVILWNERGEITESTFANIVVELDGRLLTPPVSSGILPGTMRAELLAQEKLDEAVITKAELARVTSIKLINSVRGVIDCSYISG